MSVPSRVLSAVATGLLLSASLITVGCAEPRERVVDDQPDSLMEARLRAGWDEIIDHWNVRRAHPDSELVDPQWHLAGEFFRYYQRHGDTPTGIRAGDTALMMWGNIGAADSIDAVLDLIPMDSRLWGAGLTGIGNAYYQSDRGDEFRALVGRLAQTLEEPEGLSAVHLRLASFATRDSLLPDARNHYQRVIELEAKVFDVQKARSALYELDSLNVGQPAPGFEAIDLDGNPVRLADYRGRVVLIEFWATSCGPCLPLIPYLRELHEELPESQFALIGVTDDEDMEMLHDFMEERGMTWTQVQQHNTFDDTGFLNQDPVNAAYNVFGIPRSFLIDREGRIVEKDLRNEALAEATRKLVARGT